MFVRHSGTKAIQTSQYGPARRRVSPPFLSYIRRMYSWYYAPLVALVTLHPVYTQISETAQPVKNNSPFNTLETEIETALQQRQEELSPGEDKEETAARKSGGRERGSTWMDTRQSKWSPLHALSCTVMLALNRVRSLRHRTPNWIAWRTADTPSAACPDGMAVCTCKCAETLHLAI